MPANNEAGIVRCHSYSVFTVVSPFMHVSSLFNQFNFARTPGLVEPCLSWTIEPQETEPTLARDCFNEEKMPISLFYVDPFLLAICPPISEPPRNIRFFCNLFGFLQGYTGHFQRISFALSY